MNNCKSFRPFFNSKKGWSLLWLLPIVLIAAIYLLYQEVVRKIYANSIGKPVFITSQAYGKVENVFVKPGDFVEPGKEICNFVATDERGKIPQNKVITAAIDVTTRKLNGEKYVDFIDLPGIIKPFVETEISAQVGGQIVELLICEGDRIKKGDIIARIDKRDYQIALKSAEAAFELSKKELERSRNLVKGNAMASSGLDMAETDFKNKSAIMERAKLSLERCEIVSPIDGIIDRKYVEVGTQVADGNKIVKIIDISKVKVTIGIPEKDINYVKNADHISFIVPTLGNLEVTGTVSNIILSTNDIAKVFPLIIDADNASGKLLPGMIAKAKIIREVHENAVLLPIFSVLPGDDEYFTFVYENGKAVKRVLEIGSFQSRTVHVTKGLKPGDVIIEKGLRAVFNGASVRDVN